MHVTFEPTNEPAGFQIVDSIEQRRLQFLTPEPVSPTITDTSDFRFPIGTACEIETKKLQLNRLDAVCIRELDGTFVTRIEQNEETTLTGSVYSIDISGPMKIYCEVPPPVTVSAGSGSLVLEFDREVRMTVGARSYHKQPAAKIETTEDPRDVMRAVESFSSALKDTTCERSYPTLRGHPPEIQMGEELSIPDSVAPVDTDIDIVIPPEFEYIFPVSTLSFYLGASLVPGTSPRIRTPSGEVSLDPKRLEDHVAQILKQSLFLDCIVRTEGLYQTNLRERHGVQDHLTFDTAELYQRPLHEQFTTYMSVDWDDIEDKIPTWSLTAHLPFTEEGVSALPYVVNDLGVIRKASPQPSPAHASSISTAIQNRGIMRSGTPRTQESDQTIEYQRVKPEVSDESIEHAWFGKNVPLGASKAVVEGYQNRNSRDSRSETIEITLICNDERMLDEQEKLDEVYGQREDLPFSIKTHFGLNREQLAEELRRTEADFLHYIGHATADGLECMDGELDVRELEDIGVDVFLLNACKSYRQGLALVRNGAVGGVGTTEDVINKHAIETGRTLARLLNRGFPLRSAMELVRKHTEIGNQYLILGDGSVDIAQTSAGIPMVCDVDRVGDQFEVEVNFFPTREFSTGTVSTPNLESYDKHLLVPGTTESITLSSEELRDYLFWNTSPIRNDGELIWNDELSVVDFDRFA